MKKIMALLCTVAMSVGLLAGCGSSSGDNQSVSGSDNTGDGGKANNVLLYRHIYDDAS